MLSGNHRNCTAVFNVMRPFALEPLDNPTVADDPRARFVACFAAELARMEKANRRVECWEAERLLSALGSAAVREWELALAFLAARPTYRLVRPAPLPLATLRRRFEAVMRQ